VRDRGVNSVRLFAVASRPGALPEGPETSFTRHQPAQPVTTAEVIDAAEAALATSNAIQVDLAELMVKHMRHVMNVATIGSQPAGPVLRPLALLDVDQADKFLIELDNGTHGADLPRAHCDEPTRSVSSDATTATDP
jgi:hypothetical protein